MSTYEERLRQAETQGMMNAQQHGHTPWSIPGDGSDRSPDDYDAPVGHSDEIFGQMYLSKTEQHDYARLKSQLDYEAQRQIDEALESIREKDVRDVVGFKMVQDALEDIRANGAASMWVTPKKPRGPFDPPEQQPKSSTPDPYEAMAEAAYADSSPTAEPITVDVQAEDITQEIKDWEYFEPTLTDLEYSILRSEQQMIEYEAQQELDEILANVPSEWRDRLTLALLEAKKERGPLL